METYRTNWPFYLAWFAIVIGSILTTISAFKICTTTCNEAHNFRLLGMPFEVFGGIFFAILAIFHSFARSYPLFKHLNEVLIALGLGGEFYFMWLQKYVIGNYCPICISIAASIAVLAIAYFFWKNQQSGENSMGTFKKLGLSLFLVCFGAFSSSLGVTKIDQLEAAEEDIKDKLKFGNQSSSVEVYIFTDWACPACRLVEPSLIACIPNILPWAQITFVDTVVHPETLNFAPYNISFMINNKQQYFKIRENLTKLSLKTNKPTDQDIANAVAPLGVKFHEIPYQDVSVAMRYFDDLVTRFKITGTPTVAIVNRLEKKGKKLTGAEEITEANIHKAIDSLR